MKKIIGLFFVIILSAISTSILADDYPKTEREQKWDEVGSIVGEEGLVFLDRAG